MSRHWRKVQSGSAAGALTLVRRGVFTGKQAQEIRLRSGEGELGIDNAGLFRAGINLAAGDSFIGILRLKSDTAQPVYISLRRENGGLLAEQRGDVEAKSGIYQRLTFTLRPSASDRRGRLAIVLRKPGTITLDYALLERGEAGRYTGLPGRRELADALLGMGVKAMRYNGSMVNRCPDGAKYYKWKQMIGPRDERPPYQGFFNPYASHGFSVFEFMDFCEATGIFTLFGLRIDETERDMADLVEYCAGGPETEWGRRRIADGHPKPYCLRAVQIGNEQPPNAEYLERFKALASALWSKDPNLIVLASVNVRAVTGAGPVGPKARQQKDGLATMVALATWVREQRRENQFVLDSHYQSALDHADTVIADAVGLKLHERLARSVPGFALRLWPMEENGDRCTWERGLAHAHNLNTLNRMPAGVERAGTANTFQAWNLALIWDQGRIHYTPSQIFFQPSYYVDRMLGDEWLPLVVQADCADPRLDVLARKSRNGNVVTLHVVNLAAGPVQTTLRLAGFRPRESDVTCLASGSLDARNTPDAPTHVAPPKNDVGLDAWKSADHPARPVVHRHSPEQLTASHHRSTWHPALHFGVRCPGWHGRPAHELLSIRRCGASRPNFATRQASCDNRQTPAPPGATARPSTPAQRSTRLAEPLADL